MLGDLSVKVIYEDFLVGMTVLTNLDIPVQIEDLYGMLGDVLLVRDLSLLTNQRFVTKG